MNLGGGGYNLQNLHELRLLMRIKPLQNIYLRTENGQRVAATGTIVLNFNVVYF